MIKLTFSGEEHAPQARNIMTNPITRRILNLLRKISQTLNWPLLWDIAPGSDNHIHVYLRCYPFWNRQRRASVYLLRLPLHHAAYVNLLSTSLTKVIQACADRKGNAYRPRHSFALPVAEKEANAILGASNALAYFTEVLPTHFSGHCTVTLVRSGNKIENLHPECTVVMIHPGGSSTYSACPLHTGGSGLQSAISRVFQGTLGALLSKWDYAFEDPGPDRILSEVPIERGPAFRPMVGGPETGNEEDYEEEEA